MRHAPQERILIGLLVGDKIPVDSIWPWIHAQP
jgi:hypothetical protein